MVESYSDQKQGDDPILVHVLGEEQVGKTYFIYKFFLGMDQDINECDLSAAPKSIKVAYELSRPEEDHRFTLDNQKAMSYQDIEIKEISTSQDDNKNAGKPDIIFIIFNSESQESFNKARENIFNVKVEDTKIILVGNNKSKTEKNVISVKKITEDLKEDGFKIKYGQLKKKEEIVKFFEDLIKKTYQYSCRKFKVIFNNNYLTFMNNYPVNSDLMGYSEYIEKLYQILEMSRDELKSTFDECEKLSYDVSTIKPETLLIIQTLFLKSHWDNYILTKKYCDKCKNMVDAQNTIMLSNCLHCLCTEDMISICELATHGKMDEQSFNAAKVCCEICEKKTGKQVKIKFNDAYKCKKMRYSSEQKFTSQLYEMSKSQIIEEDKQSFPCMLCNQLSQGDQFTLFFCCGKTFCIDCMNNKIKVEYQRAKAAGTFFTCPCQSKSFPIHEIYDYYEVYLK